MTNGVSRVLNNDNIAIVVLMLVCLFEAVLVAVLLRHLFQIKDVLTKVALAINTLNERLNKHE